MSTTLTLETSTRWQDVLGRGLMWLAALILIAYICTRGWVAWKSSP